MSVFRLLFAQIMLVSFDTDFDRIDKKIGSLQPEFNNYREFSCGGDSTLLSVPVPRP
jgi:hypothetical protein